MKEKTIIVKYNPNHMITVIGGDLGAISAEQVEAIYDYSTPMAKEAEKEARENGNFVAFLQDTSKVKALVRLTNGKLYQSTFNVATLAKRIENATMLDLDIED